jgi:hypothetical protein
MNNSFTKRSGDNFNFYAHAAVKNVNSNLKDAPNYVVGYTGGRFRKENKVEPIKAIVPILGFSGEYKGKVDGIVGHASCHNAPLSTYIEDKDPIESDNSSIVKLINHRKSSLLDHEADRKFIVGYTGSRFHSDNSHLEAQKVIQPIVGYKGDYHGKISGNLGRIDQHKSSLANFDKDTSYEILGNFGKK